MRAERLVVDSNVLISALLSPRGAPRQLLTALAARDATLLFGDATFAELTLRLARGKFDRYRSREQMERYLDWLTELGEWVTPNLEIDACRDASDNQFLALAIAGEADVLTSGDDDLLVLDPFEGLPILSPRATLDTLQDTD